MAKYVYTFGGGSAEGSASDKNLLGGKGANLAEMCSLRIPVPAGFTVSTECCTAYYAAGCKLPAELTDQVLAALKKTETIMGMTYGDAVNPLLISCRSGARSSMPGMMDTVLNVGLCTATIPGMIAKTKNPRFVWDSYRRLIMMYADVVMEKAEGLEPPMGKGIRKILDEKLDKTKHEKGCKSDTDLTADDLKTLAGEFKALVEKHLGKPFPDDPMAQLWGGIAAVFKSWNGKKAVSYRRIEGIPDDWGTAVNVQAMVFGNMGDSSATGVAFTRDPATGDNKFYGEWLVNAQGEDVVAGIRTPSPINDDTKNEQNKHLVSMQHAMPEIYKELDAIRTDAGETLHRHARHRVHHPGGEALDAAVPRRQTDRHRRPEHGDRHAGLKSSSTKRPPSCASRPNSSKNSSTRSSIRRRRRTPTCSSRVFPPARARPAAPWSSPPRTPWPPTARERNASCFVRRRTPRTWKGCAPPPASSPRAAA